MKSYLKKEAVEEIYSLAKEVAELQFLLHEFGIECNADGWNSTSFSDIELDWSKESFKNLEIETGDSIYLGGNVTTGYKHEYKGKQINAPKELAEVQGEITEKYFISILNNFNSSYFKLDFEIPYGLTDNEGWEQYMHIKASVKNNGIEKRLDDNEKHIISKEIKKTLSKHNLKGDISINNKQIHINII